MEAPGKRRNCEFMMSVGNMCNPHPQPRRKNNNEISKLPLVNYLNN